MRFLLFLISSFYLLSASAQTVSVTGTIADKTNNESLPGATVLLIHLPDSAQVGASTNIKGRFTFASVQPGNYLLQVSYVGFQTHQRAVQVADQPVNLGAITISEGSTQLREVQITAKIPPATQEGDTSSFNAGAFKVTRDANAEDLVQKMPGVTVENGQVKTQGENVRRVLVDGKPFFGDDPNAALKNLPAEVIDKIQVFDQLSDQAQFTGFNDGNTTKTINIITKKDKKNGRFGRVYGSIGTDERYQAGGAINQFEGDQRITILGQTNNINQQNFSSEDLSGIGSGGGGRGMGGGRWGGGASEFQVPQLTGITTTKAAGINFSDKWAKKVEVSGSYFFNQTDNDATQSLLRQYVQNSNSTDSARIYSENQSAQNRNVNHRLYGRLDWKIDSMNSLLVTPRFSFQKSEGTSGLFGNTRETSELLNQTSSLFGSELQSYNGSTDLLWRHQFKKKGRTLSVGAGGSVSGNEGDNTLLAENNFYSGNAQSDSVNQESTLNRKGYGLNGNAWYTEPISEKGQLNFTYNANYTSTDSDKRTYSYTDSVYSGLNPLLSNTFTNRYLAQSAGTGYRYGGEKYSFMISARVQHAVLSNDQEFPTDLSINRTFTDVLPMAMLRYAASKTENLRLFYRTGTAVPSAEQLQNVLNNSNPVILSIGNPDLRQNYSHNLNLRYSKTTTEKSRTIMGILSGSYTQRHIANQTFIADRDTVVLGNISLPRGAQLTRPVNLDGQVSLRSFVSYGFPVSLGKARSINVNTSLSADFGRTPGLINEQLNYANTQNYVFGLVFSSNISQNLDFTLSSTSTQVYNENTLRPQLNSEYFRQSFRLAFNYIFYKGFFVQTDVNHQFYNGLAAGFDQNFTIWNARAGKKFFEDQSMELSVSVFDILGENTSLQRNITESYIEDVNTRVLQRYFMLNFSYQLRKFYGDEATKKLQDNSQDGPRPGDFRRP